MASSPISDFLQHIRRSALRRDEAGLTDGQLLDVYVRSRDEAAFAALVHRHGPMVWGVCRRIIGDEGEAEDAFQATFLVLVRKSASVAPSEQIANWLYGVARQTAVKARAMTVKRKAREKQMKDFPEPPIADPDVSNDLLLLLDQELGSLPAKYRAAIVLCDLEGKSYKEAARQFGCPEGTLAARLTRGRAMLAKRLARHRLAVTGGALATMLSQSASAGVPDSVVSSTIQVANLFTAGQAAATGAIAPTVVALTKGVLKTMLLTKLKITMAGLFVASTAALTCGIMAQGNKSGQKKESGTERKAAAVQVAEDQTPKDKKPLLSDSIPSCDDLRGKWAGEKNGIKVDLVFEEKQAALWRVNFAPPKYQPKDPKDSPMSLVSSVADLECVPDVKAGRLNLLLRLQSGTFVGGQIQKRAEGTIHLRINPNIPTGGTHDYPAVSGLVLHRVSFSAEDVARRDQQQLQGIWEVVSVVHDGKPVEKIFYDGQVWVFDRNKIRGINPATYTLNTAQTPKPIDIVHKSRIGNNKYGPVVTDFGIYELKGDELKIAVCESKYGRPKIFESTAENHVIIHVFKRVRLGK